MTSPDVNWLDTLRVVCVAVILRDHAALTGAGIAAPVGVLLARGEAAEQDGLPVGGQLIGRHFDEARMLGVAYALERALGEQLLVCEPFGLDAGCDAGGCDAHQGASSRAAADRFTDPYAGLHQPGTQLPPAREVRLAEARVVVDPFCGVGTFLAVANALGKPARPNHLVTVSVMPTTCRPNAV